MELGALQMLAVTLSNFEPSSLDLGTPLSWMHPIRSDIHLLCWSLTGQMANRNPPKHGRGLVDQQLGCCKFDTRMR